jgi:CheY-like chemotaxis protein
MPGRIKLLIAEDSQIDAFLFQRAIEQTGVAFAARFVTDGQDVLDYLGGTEEFADRNKNPIPALIILDLKMPRLTGFDVLKCLKSMPEHRTTPVIILSGSDEPSDVDLAYSLGANTYLVKPTLTDQLAELVRALDEYWRRFAKVPGPGKAS